jgi:hypothetical protein
MFKIFSREEDVCREEWLEDLLVHLKVKSSRLGSVTFECGTSDTSYRSGSGSILGRVSLGASYKHCTNDTLESPT